MLPPAPSAEAYLDPIWTAPPAEGALHLVNGWPPVGPGSAPGLGTVPPMGADVYAELQARGMVYQATDAELGAKLAAPPLTFYRLRRHRRQSPRRSLLP